MEERPAVVLVPGYLGSPPMYAPMAARLLARGAAAVTVAPIWTPDWLLATVTGLGPLMRRTARAIADAYRHAGNRPVLLIGHSAGGLVARLATSAEPFQGHLGGVAAAVGTLVTLGTPHVVGETARHWFRAGYDACRFLDANIPGAWFAPRMGYVTVGSRLIKSGPLYALLGSETARSGWGDGLILEAGSHLAGARNLIIDGLIHAPGLPTSWYGSDEGLDGWWELAVEAWLAALETRRTMPSKAR